VFTSFARFQHANEENPFGTVVIDDFRQVMPIEQHKEVDVIM